MVAGGVFGGADVVDECGGDDVGFLKGRIVLEVPLLPRDPSFIERFRNVIF